MGALHGFRCNQGVNENPSLSGCFNGHGTCREGAFVYINKPKIKLPMRITFINEKLNGTESQRTPKWVARAMRYSGLGVRSVGPVGDFLDFVFLRGISQLIS